MRQVKLAEAVEEKLSQVPEVPGCYMIKDGQGEVLYVGKARSLRHRLRQHFSESRPISTWHQQMIRRAADFEYIVTTSEVEALILEATLIKKRRPRYNIRLADDKSYPYLVLTDEAYPRLMILRDLPDAARTIRPRQRRGFHDPKSHRVHSLGVGRIFGPYANAGAMRRTMKLVGQLFGIRTCRRPIGEGHQGTPCLNYHLRRCLGPCGGKVTREEYDERVREAAAFLSGRTEEVLVELRKEMKKAADALQFERAAVLRDRIRAIERASQEQVVVLNDTVDRDVLGAAQEADRAVVAQLVVRAGKLIMQNQMTFVHTGKHAPEEAIETFMSQHYVHGGEVPREIVVSHELADGEEWEGVLGELRGGPVRIIYPKRGAKRRLAEMAVNNARLQVARLVATEGESKRVARAAVEEIGQVLGMASPPRRIECYDVSTTGGHLIVGSMVVFTDGLPDKKCYRMFRIRTVEEKADDYAAMGEMLRRRFRRAEAGDEKFLPLPDLVLVDGGRGQLSVTEDVLAEVGRLGSIQVAAIAKEHEDVYVRGRVEPIDMTEHAKAHFLLQRVRDEAHRYGIARHRVLRDKEARLSLLEQVAGVGPKRRKALLRAFPSVEAMAQAGVDELAAVEGMTREIAEKLKAHLVQQLER
jgi:excinuclease ABC subunit C